MRNINYPIPPEIHYQAKRTAEVKGISLKQYVWDALRDQNERHKAEVAAAPKNPYKRGV